MLQKTVGKVYMKFLDEILDLPNCTEAFYLLAEYYMQASSEEREDIRNRWKFERNWNFPEPSLLACELIGEPSCEVRITASLIYDSLEDMREERGIDFREVLIGFCAVYHSAVEVGMDPVLLFDYAAGLSSSRVAKTMKAFVRRNPEDLSLEAFGFERKITDRGVEFRWSPFNC